MTAGAFHAGTYGMLMLANGTGPAAPPSFGVKVPQLQKNWGFA